MSNEISDKIATIENYIKQNNMYQELERLTQLSIDPSLWNDQSQAKYILKEKTRIEDFIAIFQRAIVLWKDYQFMQQNPEFIDESVKQSLTQIIEDLYISSCFNQPTDKLDCFLEICAGAGGIEAEDWARMLVRMYQRFCQQIGYDCELLDVQMSEHAGLINRCLLGISADKASMTYGWLKREHGVHRLVRLSPFDSNNRRHTSFASVWVTPKLDTSVIVEIDPSDLDIKECRASGAGGQHVNKTNSAIQITHKPTGITAQSQQERSQHQNRQIAMDLLKSKLYMYELEKKKAENAQHIQAKTDIAWGNHIRSYVLHPDQRIKDSRTGLLITNTQAVLDGDIKPFLVECIKFNV